MRLSQLLRGARRFARTEEIKFAVTSSDYFDANVEDIEAADLLLIFKTSTQQSWLVFTSERIYFVLDDIGSDAPEVRWRRVKDRLVSDARVIIDLKLQDVSTTTGRVNIGRMNKGFLYSKALFEQSGIKQKIYSLTEKHMLQCTNS